MSQGTLNTNQHTLTLVENATQSTAPTPVIVKAGNFKIQGDVQFQVTTGVSAGVNLMLVVFFLPEGFTRDATTTGVIVQTHPEWILSWKQLDLSSTGTQGSGFSGSGFSFSSKLKRNLNSGDRIMIGYFAENVAVAFNIKYTCQYWTCAN